MPKTKIIVISWRKNDKLCGKKTLNSGEKRSNFASFHPFVISSFRPEITKRRRLSLFLCEKTINCGVSPLKTIKSGAKYFAAPISATFISLFRIVLSLFRDEKTKAKRRRFSLFRHEKTKWHKSATIRFYQAFFL